MKIDAELDAAHMRFLLADKYIEALEMYRLGQFLAFPAIFLGLNLSLFPDDGGRLAKRITLFGTDLNTPIEISSEKGWIPLSAIDWDSSGIEQHSNLQETKWRLRTSYEHSRASGPSTMQIRLRGTTMGPTFTHPWSEGADRKVAAYSNWFEFSSQSIKMSGRGYIEARLISPPRIPLSARIYSVILEAWETVPTKGMAPEVRLSYANPLPRESPAAPADLNAVNPKLEPLAAESFALSFVEACLTGDLSKYFNAQSDPVRLLDTGKAVAKYKQRPPSSIEGVGTLEDYKSMYDYKLYDAGAISRLFPEWFDVERPWIPGRNSYLFMGHLNKNGKRLPPEIDYLVFLIEADENGDWKVVGRP